MHWSDECCFCLSKKNGNLRVWRRRGERFHRDCIADNRSSGRISCHVWGSVSNNCKLNLVVINGSLTAQKYIDNILRPEVEDHIDNHPLADAPIYQQDGASVHTAHISQAFLQNAHINVLEGPAKSPDVNIMENIWSDMQEEIKNLPQLPGTAVQLRQAVINAWNNVTQPSIRRLVASVPRRLRQIVAAEGGHINY